MMLHLRMLNPVVLTEVDVASMISQSIAAAMEVHKSMQKPPSDEGKRRGFLGTSVVKVMPRLTNRFSVLETCISENTSDMLHPSSTSDHPETITAMPPTPSSIPITKSDPPSHLYVHSADIHCCIKIPLKLHSVDTGCL